MSDSPMQQNFQKQMAIEAKSMSQESSKKDQSGSNEKIDKYDPEKAEGSWTNEENLRFSAFIDLHQTIFVSVEKRKATKIYTYMSQYIKKRSAQQCRSHFQKILLKFGNIFAFIARMKKIYGEVDYHQVIKECPIAYEALQSIGETFYRSQIPNESNKISKATQTDKVHIFSSEQYNLMLQTFQKQIIERYTNQNQAQLYTFNPIFFPFN